MAFSTDQASQEKYFWFEDFAEALTNGRDVCWDQGDHLGWDALKISVFFAADSWFKFQIQKKTCSFMYPMFGTFQQTLFFQGRALAGLYK